MNRTLILFYAFIIIFGFPTINYGKEAVQRVDNMEHKNAYITREKAIEIARSKMEKEGLSKKYNLLKPKIVFETETTYGIKFYPRFSLSPNAPYLKYLVSVEKKAGDIIGFGEDK